ncbi:hypothetical protein CLIB1423_10S00210 [[Candida] railenensis]|uniref:CobW C-terminal domain-containing protein n=1 Tax=[Candida] railenensis TaxID=45579 RepID=A0A9P0VZ70_9ASCO|nr:hypothetical protein CLIB1423_10S00210 [[Candida] railenensis]
MVSVKRYERQPIPITLLSGFLGSGKTTLLEKILTTSHGLKIAVIINDMSSLNIDAALIQDHKVTKKEEKLIQLQNGCICCTLRGDLLDELVKLAKSGEFQYIIIESTGISEPIQVAETFTTEFTEMLLSSDSGEDDQKLSVEERKVLAEIIDLGGLNKLTKLDTCVTVIDSHSFMSNFETTDFLINRFGDSGQNEQERTITDLMVDQIEFADVIIINKVSTVSKKKMKKIDSLIHSLNPVAKILKSNYCNVDISEVLNTGLYDFEKASTSAGWLQSINEMTQRKGFGKEVTKAKMTPKPETEEFGINNFVYQSRKPFHPEKLYKLIRDKFVIIEQAQFPDDAAISEHHDQSDIDNEIESEDVEYSEDELSLSDSDSFTQPSEKQIVRNKKKSAFAPLLRSKGFFWLASRHIIRGEWSSAGPMLTLKGGIPWFAVTGPDFYPPEAKKLIEEDMKGEFGDRRNELVFIGLNIDKGRLTKELDECLLSDSEYNDFKRIVKGEKNLFYVEKKLSQTYNDGFENWLVFDDKDIEEVDETIESVADAHGHNLCQTKVST